MRLPVLPCCALLLSALSSVNAVYSDEVGDVDFHYDLLGVPQASTTFFHRPRREEKASLLYTLSDVGVLGAVNPSNGAVVWRQFVSGNITSGGGHLRAGEGQSWVCGAYGKSVHAWNAFTGRNVWWMDFVGEVKDLEIMELTENGRKDVLVLFEEAGAMMLRRLNGDDGTVVWEFRDSGKDVPLQVSTNIEKVFLVSLNGSPSSYSVKVSVLDIPTGTRLDEIILGTKGDVHGPRDVMFVGSNSASPIVAWADSKFSKLRINVLGLKTKQEFPLTTDTVAVDVHAPHLAQSEPHFLVHSRTKTGNRADVYHINLKTNVITLAYELPHLPGHGAFSTSSDGANVYFTRVTEEEVVLTASTSHGILARWPFKRGTDIDPIHAVSEVIKRSTDSYAIRSAVTTSSDDWALVKNGEIDWSRPEGMSGAVGAAWAEVPESEEFARMLEQEAHNNPLSAYIHRVNRHIHDLQYLPDYLFSIPKRLAASVVGGLSQKKSVLARDSFGFSKIIVLATRRGRLYALDTGNHGRVLWSQSAFKMAAGEHWDVKGMFVEDSKGQVTVRGSHGEYIAVKTDTGHVIETMPPGSWPPVQSTVVVDSPSGQWLMPIGHGGKVGDIPAERIPKQTLVVRGDHGELKGVTIKAVGATSKETVAWTFNPPVGQSIVALASRAPHDIVASIGRVQSDRTVMYKYLNPNTIVVACVKSQDSSLAVYLLDSVSGQVLTSSQHAGVDTTKPIDCTMAENWYACTFFGKHMPKDVSGQSLQSYQIFVSDLYESDLSNDRGPLGDSTNYSSLEPIDQPAGPALPHVITQSWILGAPVTALSVTQTRQGISRRHVLAYTPETHSIIGLPRELLDPRRPVGREPTAGEMEAEGLMKYAPVIEIDPRATISHTRDIIGVEKIIAAPTIVESTSLIVAFGVDVFGSRVTPSQEFDILGKGFNKISLVGTVLALTIGVMVLGPMVRKKQINMRWEAPM